jgi:hypothetical protein
LDAKRAIVEDVSDDASNEESDHKSTIKADCHRLDTEHLDTTISPDAGQTVERVRHDVQRTAAYTSAHDWIVVDGK